MKTVFAILFLVAVIPLILRRKPFTWHLVARKYPKVISESAVFMRIHNIISLVWAAVYALSFLLAYSGGFIRPFMIIPFGILASVLMPGYILKRTGSPVKFKTLKEAFEAMPYSVNRKAAAGVDVVVQFDLSGKEAQISHMVIKDSKCSLCNAPHSNPTLTIKADSGLWLAIINKETDNTKAFLEGRLVLEGDISVIRKFSAIFSRQEIKRNKPRVQDYNYKTLKPGRIKNIVVIDGGARSGKYSKTTLMADKFTEGAESAGAKVEKFVLRELGINECVGCYTCWTKTPGTCIIKDPMNELLMKYREADLIVFASPLYVFNVTAHLKVFMDRSLPLLVPYMKENPEGQIVHPGRYPESDKQGFVVFSAAGFPDIDGNFDGLKGMFRAWDKHHEGAGMLGEFYLPAAEMLSVPIFSDRKAIVEKACFDAGVQAVNEGRIDFRHMSAITDIMMDSDEFMRQANIFWSTLDGGKSYMSAVKG